VEGTFKWVTGEPFEFGEPLDPWNTNQPDNYQGVEHYVHFKSNFKWNDLPVDHSIIKGYLVEYQCACFIESLAVQSATASSQEGDWLRPGRAVDGRRRTRWASKNLHPKNAEVNEWIHLDLGGVRFIDSIRILWERAYSRDYKVEVSKDGTNWHLVINPKSSPNRWIRRFVELDVGEDAHYVRIDSKEGDPNWGISIKEIEILGDQHESCVPTPLECRGDEIDSQDFSVIASSTENDMGWLDAVNAIDGDAGTRWASAWADNEWLAVDLKTKMVVTEIEINWENAYAVDYDLQISEDGSNPWTTVVAVRGSEGAVELIDFLSTETQFVRLLSLQRATHYGTSLFDFIVHGTTNPSCLAPYSKYINAGGGEVTDSVGNVWEADEYFNGGNTYSTTEDIAGTADDVLYKTERWIGGTEDLIYTIPVPLGVYDVKLHFAEIYFDEAPGERVFDVFVQGMEILPDLDIFSVVGHDKAHILEIPNVAARMLWGLLRIFW
jgi:hypothetical protein